MNIDETKRVWLACACAAESAGRLGSIPERADWLLAEYRKRFETTAAPRTAPVIPKAPLFVGDD